MSKLDYPKRIFSLSDCHGGQKQWDPITSPDTAAQLAESIRSDFPEITRIDTRGVDNLYYAHIVKEALRLHEENPESYGTGIFINSAPRTKKSNGAPFYVAEFNEDLRVVTTTLKSLSFVRDKVSKLYHLPNENNGLYGNNEQHRSSFTPRLLAPNHGLEIIDDDLNIITTPPSECRLSYIDRFGNVVLYEAIGTANGIRAQIDNRIGETVSIRNQRLKKVNPVNISTSLGAAEPGSLNVYQNDDSIEVIGKWQRTDVASQKADSAYHKLSQSTEKQQRDGTFWTRPEIGDTYEIADS